MTLGRFAVYVGVAVVATAALAAVVFGISRFRLLSPEVKTPIAVVVAVVILGIFFRLFVSRARRE